MKRYSPITEKCTNIVTVLWVTVMCVLLNDPYVLDVTAIADDLRLLLLIDLDGCVVVSQMCMEIGGCNVGFQKLEVR